MTSVEQAGSAEHSIEQSEAPEIGGAFERLARKIEILLGLRTEIQAITIEQDPGEVTARLNQWYADTAAGYPELQVKENQRISEINETIDQLQKKVAAANLTTDEAEHQRREIFRLQDERRELYAHPDIMFLMRLRSVVDQMAAKNRYIHTTPQSLLVNEYMRRQNMDFVPTKDITAAQTGPFDVVFVTSDEGFLRLGGEKWQSGFHLRGSPFSVVRPAHQDIEPTIRHEQLHNLLDASGVPNSDFSEVLKARQSALADPESADQSIKAHIKKLMLELTPAQLLYPLQEELLTGLERAESLDFGHNFSGQAEPAGRNKFTRLADAFSTAGLYARRISEVLDTMSLTLPDPAAAAHCRRLREQFRQLFITTIENIRAGIQVGRRLGGEQGVFEAHALMLILPPDRYGLIERYLARKYGPEQTAFLGKTGWSGSAELGSQKT